MYDDMPTLISSPTTQTDTTIPTGKKPINKFVVIGGIGVAVLGVYYYIKKKNASTATATTAPATTIITPTDASGGAGGIGYDSLMTAIQASNSNLSTQLSNLQQNQLTNIATGTSPSQLPPNMPGAPMQPAQIALPTPGPTSTSSGSGVFTGAPPGWVGDLPGTYTNGGFGAQPAVNGQPAVSGGGVVSSQGVYFNSANTGSFGQYPGAMGIVNQINQGGTLGTNGTGNITAAQALALQNAGVPVNLI